MSSTFARLTLGLFLEIVSDFPQSGAAQWKVRSAKIIGDVDQPPPARVAIDEDGNILFGSGSAAYLTKLDANGNVLWQLRNQPPNGTYSYINTTAIATVGQDIYFLAMFNGPISIGSITNGYGSVLARTDKNGHIVWADYISSLYTGVLAASSDRLAIGGTFRNSLTYKNYVFEAAYSDVLVASVDL